MLPVSLHFSVFWVEACYCLKAAGWLMTGKKPLKGWGQFHQPGELTKHVQCRFLLSSAVPDLMFYMKTLVFFQNCTSETYTTNGSTQQVLFMELFCSLQSF